MQSVSLDLLRQVIEHQHGGKATFFQSQRLTKGGGNAQSWDGVVHLFNLAQNPNAKRAYAWASPIAGSGAPRYFAVLHHGRIRNATDAVKAAAAAIQAQATLPKAAPPKPVYVLSAALLTAEAAR